MKAGHAKIADGDLYYFYDTATNAVVRVTPTVFEVLDDYLWLGPRAVRRKYANQVSAKKLACAVDFLRACQRRGMLQPMRRLNYLPVTSTANLRKHYTQGLKRMTLGITERCNQRCHYCPYGAAGGEIPNRGIMSWDTARRSIDYLMRQAAPGRVPTLELYGGEPLLNWSIVERAIRYVRGEMRRPDVEIVLYTNATLLERSRLEALIANRVVLQISIDGPSHVHDKSRILANGQGTHTHVLRVLHWIRHRNSTYYRKYVRLHCTFSLEDNLLEIFRYFSRTVFRRLQISFSHRLGAFRIFPPDQIRHEAELDELMEQYLRALRARRSFNRALFAAIISDVFGIMELRAVGRADSRPQPNNACLPGQTRVFVSVTGSFHPCENSNWPGSEIGNFRSGVVFDKSQRLLRSHARLCNRMCQRCWAWRLCSLCFLHSIGADGRPSRARKEEACRAEKQRIVQSLRRYIHLWNNEPERAVRIKDTLRYSMAHQNY